MSANPWPTSVYLHTHFLASVDDNAVPPPQKKARISKRAQNPPNQGEGSSSSAPQRRVTVVIRPPQPPKKKHAIPPTIQDEVLAHVPLPALPIPPSHEHSPPLEPLPPQLSPAHPSNISWDRRLDDIIQWVEDVARQILDHREDRLLALEGQLADCRLTIGTLTREVETLRASVHEEAEESIAAQLPGPVVTETQTGQELGMRGQQEPSVAAQVEEESSSVQVGNETGMATGDSSSAQDGSGSGEASTGHQEEGGSGGASADISSVQDGTGSGEASTGHVEASGDISSAQDGGGSALLNLSNVSRANTTDARAVFSFCDRLSAMKM
ncbi:hypothetical protein EDD15DRAFT_2190668 [Pisolithus albus]|nr:hypothetical protein EDD15DRAFT_2190668 [Pisolithus albus]